MNTMARWKRFHPDGTWLEIKAKLEGLRVVEGTATEQPLADQIRGLRLPVREHTGPVRFRFSEIESGARA